MSTTSSGSPTLALALILTLGSIISAAPTTPLPDQDVAEVEPRRGAGMCTTACNGMSVGSILAIVFSCMAIAVVVMCCYCHGLLCFKKRNGRVLSGNGQVNQVITAAPVPEYPQTHSQQQLPPSYFGGWQVPSAPDPPPAYMQPAYIPLHADHASK